MRGGAACLRTMQIDSYPRKKFDFQHSHLGPCICIKPRRACERQPFPVQRPIKRHHPLAILYSKTNNSTCPPHHGNSPLPLAIPPTASLHRTIPLRPSLPNTHPIPPNPLNDTQPLGPPLTKQNPITNGQVLGPLHESKHDRRPIARPDEFAIDVEDGTGLTDRAHVEHGLVLGFDGGGVGEDQDWTCGVSFSRFVLSFFLPLDGNS